MQESSRSAPARLLVASLALALIAGCSTSPPSDQPAGAGAAWDPARDHAPPSPPQDAGHPAPRPPSSEVQPPPETRVQVAARSGLRIWPEPPEPATPIEAAAFRAKLGQSADSPVASRDLTRPAVWDRTPASEAGAGGPSDAGADDQRSLDPTQPVGSQLPAGPATAEQAGAPPENLILDRNLHPDGADPYQLDLEQVHLRELQMTPDGVTLTMESGRALRAKRSGEPVVSELREQMLFPVSGDRYVDVLEGVVLVVGADPLRVNEVIKDVDGYHPFFDDRYHHSYYKHDTRRLAIKELQGRLERNQESVLSGLTPWGLQVTPESSRFMLEIIIGKKNWVAKDEVKLEMISTSYVLEDEEGQLVRIVNENELVRPEGPKGTQDQHVLWVLHELPGTGTLARYYQASISLKPLVGLNRDYFREKRLELTRQNIVDYLRGIRDRARETL